MAAHPDSSSDPPQNIFQDCKVAVAKPESRPTLKLIEC